MNKRDALMPINKKYPLAVADGSLQGISTANGSI